MYPILVPGRYSHQAEIRSCWALGPANCKLHPRPSPQGNNVPRRAQKIVCLAYGIPTQLVDKGAFLFRPNGLRMHCRRGRKLPYFAPRYSKRFKIDQGENIKRMLPASTNCIANLRLLCFCAKDCEPRRSSTLY